MSAEEKEKKSTLGIDNFTLPFIGWGVLFVVSRLFGFLFPENVLGLLFFFLLFLVYFCFVGFYLTNKKDYSITKTLYSGFGFVYLILILTVIVDAAIYGLPEGTDVLDFLPVTEIFAGASFLLFFVFIGAMIGKYLKSREKV